MDRQARIDRLTQRMMTHHAKREYVVVKARTPEQRERQERVIQSNARTQRLIGWLTFFRHPDEQGIGDTASRLIQVAKHSPDAHTLIKRLLTMCSCSRSDAVAKLNKEHPYDANTRNLDGWRAFAKSKYRLHQPQ